MLAIILTELEEKIGQLPREEQFRLIERLVRRLREDATNGNAVKEEFFEKQLIAMANDPAMQAELKQINEEFAITEADGLARV
jgi:hypothetical protein